jgi:hypothetical protein
VGDLGCLRSLQSADIYLRSSLRLLRYRFDSEKIGGPQALPGGAQPLVARAVDFNCEYLLPKVLFFQVMKN